MGMGTMVEEGEVVMVAVMGTVVEEEKERARWEMGRGAWWANEG